jgi:hypothetical protein
MKNINYRMLDTILHSIALDALCWAIYSHLNFTVPDSANDLMKSVQDTPFQNWRRTQRAIAVLFDIESVVEVSEAYSALSYWETHCGDRHYSWCKTAKSYSYYKKKMVNIDLVPFAKLIAGFSCIENIDDCRDLMIPEDLSRPGSAFSQMNLLRGRRGKRTRYGYRETFAGTWDASTLLKFFGTILIGSQYRWDDEKRLFLKTSLISENGWSVFLPTVGLLDPSAISFYDICLRRGVPTRNEERKHRLIDAYTSVELVDRLKNFQKLEGLSDEVERYLGKDFSGAAVSSVHVAIRNDAFVVSQSFQSDWGQVTSGFRNMHNLALTPNLKRIPGCEHPSSVSFNQHTEWNLIISHGYNPLHPKQNLQNRSFIMLPVTGNTAARWACIVHAEATLNGYDTIIALRQEDTCINCFFDFVLKSDWKPYRQEHGKVVIL